MAKFMKNFYKYFLCCLVLFSLTQCGKNKERLEGNREAFLEVETTIVPDPDAENFNIELEDTYNINDWPQMGGNGAHSMPNAVVGDVNKVLWKETIGSGSSAKRFLLGGPVIKNGILYTIDAEGMVQARDGKTGKLKWKINTKARKSKKPYRPGGGVAAGNKRLYVASPFSEVLAIDVETGFIYWRTPILNPARSAPAVDNNRVYVLTNNNRVLSFDVQTGEKVWEHEGTPEALGLIGGAAPAVYNHVVFAPYSTGELYALKAENGHPLWAETLTTEKSMSSVSMLSQIRARPVVYKNTVIATSQNGRTVALDYRTGNRLWAKDFGGTHTPVVNAEFIFLITNENVVLGIVRETGQIAWVTELNRYEDPEKKKKPILWAGPVLADNKLFLVSSDKNLITLNPENGEILREMDLPGSALLSPIIADKIMYILLDSGTLIAIE
jgi:outer membrane protein assembly factor BamB